MFKTKPDNYSYVVVILKNKVDEQVDMARKDATSKYEADAIAKQMCMDIEKEIPNEETIPVFDKINNSEISLEQYLYTKQKKKIVVMEIKYFDYFYSHLSEFIKDL